MKKLKKDKMPKCIINSWRMSGNSITNEQISLRRHPNEWSPMTDYGGKIFNVKVFAGLFMKRNVKGIHNNLNMHNHLNNVGKILTFLSMKTQRASM